MFFCFFSSYFNLILFKSLYTFSFSCITLFISSFKLLFFSFNSDIFLFSFFNILFSLFNLFSSSCCLRNNSWNFPNFSLSFSISSLLFSFLFILFFPFLNSSNCFFILFNSFKFKSYFCLSLFFSEDKKLNLLSFSCNFFSYSFSLFTNIWI